MAALTDSLFALTPAIRYVAAYLDGQLTLQERPGLSHASSSESDKYEELIVNPALITLARQRGEIDCGGLEYLIVRYGHFFQLVLPVRGGHVSVAFETEASPVEWVGEVRRVVERGVK